MTEFKAPYVNSKFCVLFGKLGLELRSNYKIHTFLPPCPSLKPPPMLFNLATATRCVILAAQVQLSDHRKATLVTKVEVILL